MCVCVSVYVSSYYCCFHKCQVIFRFSFSSFFSPLVIDNEEHIMNPLCPNPLWWRFKKKKEEKPQTQNVSNIMDDWQILYETHIHQRIMFENEMRKCITLAREHLARNLQPNSFWKRLYYLLLTEWWWLLCTDQSV